MNFDLARFEPKELHVLKCSLSADEIHKFKLQNKRKQTPTRKIMRSNCSESFRE